MPFCVGVEVDGWMVEGVCVDVVLPRIVGGAERG